MIHDSCFGLLKCGAALVHTSCMNKKDTSLMIQI